MAGCQGAKTIVAINTDAVAPIVSKADYAVIGDLHEVLPALIEAIKARGGA
jgi:electron transfer flavoprotein alpha subunit